MTTCAPRRASSVAATWPIPEVAPVTTQTLPCIETVGCTPSSRHGTCVGLGLNVREREVSDANDANRSRQVGKSDPLNLSRKLDSTFHQPGSWAAERYLGSAVNA